MSFSLPKNVPRFNSSQRDYENVYWGSSGRTHQNANINGLGEKLGGMLDNKDLPMYKDKPYSYAASRRYRPWLRRKRVWAGVLLSTLTLLFWFALFSSKTGESPESKHKSWSIWDWFKRPTESVVDWEVRREIVKEVFKLSWDAYEHDAWGMDEYYPVSRTGRKMTPTGMGWIIVDSLDTLMIMNLTSRLSHARAWMSTSLNYNQDQEVNTFETTIRMLGGLLSAHYLSSRFPEMAPLSEDEQSKMNDDLYLEIAADLADRLLGAFETPSGVPFASVNLKTLKGIPSHEDGGASSTAEAASLQLEFKYLAMLMGEKTYWQKSEKVIQVIDDNGMEDGLLPIFIYADRGSFRGENIRLGSRGDSYYEYLIKQYLQTSKQEPIYLELWEQALAGIRKHLIAYSRHANFTVLAERPDGLKGGLSPKMDHLVCFMPGTIALAATGGLTLEEARNTYDWGKQQEEDVELARELTKTCWGMYKAAATGLAPEIMHFQIDDPPRMEVDGKVSSAEVDFSNNTASEASSWISDFIIKEQDSHNLQRPETAESLFYMWRITGDVRYREWGWEMFNSFVEFTAIENSSEFSGFTSLSKANKIPPVQKDNMESFWLAETLKYFYLLFSPNDLLPLNSIVINTEAHIFPRFELQRELKTGWQRKPRDAQGNIVSVAQVEDDNLHHQKGPSQSPLKTIKVVDAKSEQ